MYDLLLLGKSCVSFGKHFKAETHEESCAVMRRREFHLEGSENSIKCYMQVAA